MPIFDFICFLSWYFLREVRVHDRSFFCNCLYALLQWFKINSRNRLLDSIHMSIWLYLDWKVWLMIWSLPYASTLLKIVWQVLLGVNFLRIAGGLCGSNTFCVLIIIWPSTRSKEIFRFSHLWILIVILDLPQIFLSWRCGFWFSHCQFLGWKFRYLKLQFWLPSLLLLNLWQLAWISYNDNFLSIIVVYTARDRAITSLPLSIILCGYLSCGVLSSFFV